MDKHNKNRNKKSSSPKKFDDKVSKARESKEQEKAEKMKPRNA
jgi:hypothetical protein